MELYLFHVFRVICLECVCIPISRIAHSGIAYLFRAKGSPPPCHGTGSSKHFIKRKQSEVFSLQQVWVFFSRDLRVSALEPTLFPGSLRRRTWQTAGHVSPKILENGSRPRDWLIYEHVICCLPGSSLRRRSCPRADKASFGPSPF